MVARGMRPPNTHKPNQHTKDTHHHMPKLPADVARAAEQAAEEGGPAPIPEAIYLTRLYEVEAPDKDGPSGYPYWLWRVRVEDEGYKGKELAMVTSLSPKAQFAFGNAFAAFGVPADTNTDELLGRLIRASVSITVQTKGQYAGAKQNSINYFLPLEEGDEEGQSPLDGDF